MSQKRKVNGRTPISGCQNILRFFGRFAVEPVILVRVVILFFFGLLFSHLNPLGADDRVREYSRDLYNSLFGPSASTTTAGRFAVVLVTDGTLDEIDAAWPLPYGTHADILQAIIDRKPTALFIDIMFIDRRRRDATVGDLSDALNSANNVPIFLAALRKDDHLFVIPELAPDERKAERSVKLVPVDEVERRNEHVRYRLSYDEPGRDGAVLEFSSPALSLYRAACMNWEGTATSPDGCKDAHSAGEWNRPMEIEWPIGVPVQPNGTIVAESLAGQKCTKPIEGKFGRSLVFLLPRFLTRPFVPGEGSGEELLRQSCPAIPVVLAQNLLLHDRNDPSLAAAIEGKIVVYGLALAGGGDIVQPPHHLPLPGAFVHAVAAENLLRLGSSYYSTELRGSVFLSSERLEGLLELISHGLLYIFTFVALRRMKAIAASKGGTGSSSTANHGYPRGLLARTIFHIGQICPGNDVARARKTAQIQAVRISAWIFLVVSNLILALLWVAMEVNVMRIAPSNWIAIVSIIAAASPLIAPYVEPEKEDPEVVRH
ncbi:MAG: CHASE2 domain-containing protein [Proteobacteria bacterium]|nr:CHASE2 domain-containing protein [Pseudomonadota bacterium]